MSLAPVLLSRKTSRDEIETVSVFHLCQWLPRGSARSSSLRPLHPALFGERSEWICPSSCWSPLWSVGEIKSSVNYGWYVWHESLEEFFVAKTRWTCGFHLKASREIFYAVRKTVNRSKYSSSACKHEAYIVNTTKEAAIVYTWYFIKSTNLRLWTLDNYLTPNQST